MGGGVVVGIANVVTIVDLRLEVCSRSGVGRGWLKVRGVLE